MQTEIPDIPLLIRLIEENPEWRALFRQVLLSADLLELPELFRRLSAHIDALTESHRRSEERLDRLEAVVQELAEAQRRTDKALQALAEAQRRTEQRVEELAEAQRRTEQRVEELAEAQRRTEQRVEELAEAQRRTEQRVEELAEAQRRTDEKVDTLGQKVDRLAVEVNNLRRTIGATIEEEAEDWVACLLEEKGYQLLEEPRQIRMDGEIDVAMPVARDGQVVWAVVEAKTRLSRREIEDWANRMRSEGFRRRLARHGVPGPYLVYVYGLRVDAACDPAARQFGIGLITGRGERVPPGPLFPPAEPDRGEEN
jgi:chromosome segregation ATPase